MKDGTQLRGNPRLPRFVRPRCEPAAALAATRVGIIGAGAIGFRIARELASLGPKAIDVVDPKHTKAESLYTHGISPREVGMQKAALAAETIDAISPTTRVRGITLGIAEVDPSVVATWTFAFLATDNLAAEVQGGQCCMTYGVPLIHASVDGDTLFAQIRFFGNRDAEGPCPACLLSAREWRLLHDEVQFSCDGSALDAAEVPTRSTGSLCATAASLALNALVCHVVGLGPDRRDHMMEYAGYTDTITVTPLRRNAACPGAHVRYRTLPRDEPMGRLTARGLAERAGVTGDAGLAATQFGVEGQCWSGRAQCSACGWTWTPNRFMAPTDVRSVRCPRCDGGGPPCHVFTQPSASGRQLAASADVRLVTLCDASPSAFMVRPPDGPSFLLRVSEEEAT